MYAYCEGVIEFRSLPSQERIFWERDQRSAVETFLRSHQHEDVYFGVATRINSTSGKLENCRHLVALFMDLDFKGRPEEAARKQIKECSLPPSICIASGHGLHVYWLLKEPLDLQDTKDVALARQLLRRLATYFQADLNSAEPARILRLPDTFNFKYDPPRKVTVERTDYVRRYDPLDFDEWLPEEPALNSTHSENIETIPQGERNSILYQYGRKLHAMRLPEDEIQRILHRVNHEQCDPPLLDHEVDQIAHKAANASR